MKQKLFALSLGFGALIFASQHAFSQTTPNCAKRDDVVAQLAAKFGETRQSIGLAANNAVIETFVSTSTGTWTITVTGASGMTCLVASGQNFETLAVDAPVAGKGA
ncbi:MAG: hypothetical protein WBC68_15220 [Albidovulum sp.]